MTETRKTVGTPPYIKQQYRGIDDSIRSLAEAYPEFYEALDKVTAALCLRSSSRDGHAMAAITKAHAILKRMRGGDETAALEGKTP